MKSKKFLNVIKILWLVAVVAGGIYYVVKNYDAAIQYISTIEPVKLIISFLLIVAVRILNVDLIQRSLVIVGWKPNFSRAFSLVSISQLGKYIPGGIWQFVARFGAYKENQLSNKDMGKSFLIENIWLVAGAFFCSLAFLFLSIPNSVVEKYQIFLSVQLRVLLTLVCIFAWLLTLVIIEHRFDPRTKGSHARIVLTQFVTQAVMWILTGISFYVLLPVAGSLNDICFSIGAFGLAFLAGYVVIIAPGGIGVREYVAAVLFAIMYANLEIGIFTIVHRLLYTIVEFLLAGIAYLLPNKASSVENGDPGSDSAQSEDSQRQKE